MRSNTFSAASIAAATLFFQATLASNIPKCGADSQCPEDSPCCSMYGQCGVGAYCLGGCDPRYSFSLTSCVAAPVCKSADYNLNSLDGIARNTVYLGDSSTANWVSSGTPVVYNDESILLTMAPSTVGTLLMGTHYVWYGKICATMQSSQGTGVVTAFIMMSDVQDEIDYEWVGTDVDKVQSNYYWQGVLDYQNMKNLSVSSTRTTSHEYCIDWQPDSLTWSIDGDNLRTVHKKDTYNKTSMIYHYPQTPSRVQISLWPAGLPSNGNGTIEWAGGLVDWDSPYMQNGYYYAILHDVSVECYDPPTDEGWVNTGNGNSAYYYTSSVGTNSTIAIGNNSTKLASFYASGDNPNFDPNASASASASTSKSTPTTQPETVPGMSGGGHESVQNGDSGSSNGGSSSGSSGSSGSGSSSSSDGGQYSSFDQGNVAGTSGGSKSGGVAGSALALVGFFVVAVML
ncbi:glycoside hydrolase family 16 protein [Polychaeton citri CBS 116435]|uniref:Crh-like protein n=1 Tax=Polychaeton citri CBS 116435 TaxID=1314669 RepID=A0A9P4QEN6_9PEZI|nr:glycoside hydrolase family 16 protein [Polychaeton citri CBS 116435]